MAYTNVSDEFKEIVKSNSITASAKIIFPNLNLTILPHATDNLKSSLADLTIYDKCCDNGKYIGNAVSKKVELSIINKDNLDLADQEFELYVGVKLSNGEYEYIPYGNFIVTAYTDTKSNNKFKIEAYDYMTKLNGYFSNILYNKKTNPNGLKIDYPIKLKDFKEKILSYMKIDYVNQTLPNDNFDIKVEINFDGYTIRNVIAKIAELQGTFARINRENKMEFCLQTQTDEEIPLSSMNNKQEINNRYGPVNVVSLTMKNVKGENVTLRDDKSIDKYGENTIEIQDNPFVYTEALREKAIEELYSALDGFSYYPINFNWKARLYTDGSDIIKVYDMRNKKWVNSIIMNQTIKIPATRQSTLESPALTKTQVANQYISQSKQANTRTEIMVDKQEQKIQSVVNQIGDRSKKQTTITQDIDGINSKVENLEDVTGNAEGLKEIELQNCVAGPLLELHIYGNNTVFDYLFPRNDLYPSDTLYPQADSRIVVTDKDGNSKIYELGVLDVLRQNGNVRDEYVLEKGKAKVIRRINKNGTIKTQEEIEDLGELSIPLKEGTNTIRIQNYNANIKAKFAIQSDYTDVFATKVEMNSSITQTAKEINLEVRKKVDEEDFTGANIMLAINGDSSSATINADKININGVISANGNFEIDKEGNVSLAGNIYMTGTNTKIVGGDGLITNLQFKEDGYVGIDYGADGSVIRTGIACCVDIPEKFTIIEAKLIVQHSTLKSYEYSNELTTYFGNCKNISCTKTNSIEYERLGASSIVYQPVIPLYKEEEVSNIGSFSGSQTKEFTITDKLSTGIQYLIFADYVDNPSTYNDAYNLTGHITAFVDVTGYMRI